MCFKTKTVTGRRQTTINLKTTQTGFFVLTGRTRPRSVISPVMATSERTSRPLKSEARQVAMVTPADGPSFVTAPAGKCRWMSVFSRRSKLPEALVRWYFLALLRSQLMARWADSFMTSPSWPVRVNWPSPSMRLASTNIISPPRGVQAKPIATPG